MDPLHTALQLAFKSPGTHFFGILQERPEILSAFSTFMSVQRDGRPNFADFYPVDKQLAEGFSSNQDAVLLVDVGGAHGQEILEMKQRFPTLPGRTVLQDQPSVIKECSETRGLEVMAHNFFDPQPIRGK